MARVYPTEKLLGKVIEDLRDFLPYLVLVGGWIPYLYQKHVWPPELTGEKPGTGAVQASTPLSTTDMDFGVTLAAYPGAESIADRVRKLGYGERHVSMARMIPFVPIARGKGENEKAEVEFITVLNPPKHVHEKLVGREIKINNIKHFEILLENARKISFYSQEVQIPTEAAFVFHKLLTFVLRKNEDKKREEGKKVINNIKTFFAHKDAKGPVFIEMEIGTDYFIRNVRSDAYERIKPLIE